MICTKCKKDLPENEFQFRIDRNKYSTICKECTREYRKSWCQSHPEKVAQYSRKWRTENPEKKKSCWKNWYKSSPKGKEWKDRNARTESGKLIRARIRHKRKAISKEVPNTLTLQEWLLILTEQNNRCAICGIEFTGKIRPQKDHKIPLTEGGSFTKNNIQALCKNCNVKKDATLEQRKENKIKYQ